MLIGGHRQNARASRFGGRVTLSQTNFEHLVNAGREEGFVPLVAPGLGRVRTAG